VAQADERRRAPATIGTGAPRWRGYGRAVGAGELLVSTPVAAPAARSARELLAYLPPGYAARGRHPVVVLLDGQNLFDEATAFAGSWNVATAIDELAAEGLAPVVIGVPNGGRARPFEYSPFRDPRFGGGGAATTLDFLERRLRPLVERAFGVSRAGADWTIGGSSLGGHFALWAFFAAREPLGGALAMSPTTLFAGEALAGWLETARRRPGRIWLDCGAEEGRRPGARARTGRRPRPTAYVRRVRRLRRALEAKGFRRGETLGYLEQAGAGHQESAWASRLPGALRFLLAGP
jgi:predicted alpha/beta superfamily hydrolase